MPLEKKRSVDFFFLFNLKPTKPVKLIPFVVGEIEARKRSWSKTRS